MTKTEEIILNALKEAALMGYYKDDEICEEAFVELARDTTTKLIKIKL